MSRLVYVLMMSGDGAQPHSHAPMDACQGVFVSHWSAAATAEHECDASVEIAEAEESITLGWVPPLDEPAYNGAWQYMDAGSSEVHAVIAQVELERRIVGDRRGTGR